MSSLQTRVRYLHFTENFLVAGMSDIENLSLCKDSSDMYMRVQSRILNFSCLALTADRHKRASFSIV